MGWLKRFIIALLRWLRIRRNRPGRINFPTLGGHREMYIVKNDNPAVEFTIEAPIVTDAEGEEVGAQDMVFNTSSTDPAVVQVNMPDPTDMLHGNISFGHSGPATVNVQVLHRANGTLLGAFAAVFQVTTGDPASIVGGKITFAGLTEVEG